MQAVEVSLAELHDMCDFILAVKTRIEEQMKFDRIIKYALLAFTIFATALYVSAAQWVNLWIPAVTAIVAYLAHKAEKEDREKLADPVFEVAERIYEKVAQILDEFEQNTKIGVKRGS